jgi:hypothetical protein
VRLAGEAMGNVLEKVNASAVKGDLRNYIAGLQEGSIVPVSGASVETLIAGAQKVLRDKRNVEGLLAGLATGLAGVKVAQECEQ